MKNIFPGYFAKSAESMDKLWAEALIVLDTNVLLACYRYSDSTRHDLIGLLEKVSDRIWIPHQVGKEFLEGRAGVIGDQIKHYKDQIASIQAFKGPLESPNNHPFVSSGLLQELQSVLERIKTELETNKGEHEKRIYDDEIRERIARLFDGKVGGPYDRARLEVVITEGRKRYDERVPPGWKDEKKGGEAKQFHLRIKPFGDYIIWLQTMEQAKTAGRSVIFVTADEKEDWWLPAEKGKSIGPLPELIEEFMTETGQQFYMYTPSSFLQLGSEKFHSEASLESVEEIRELQHQPVTRRSLVVDSAWAQQALKGSPDDWINSPDALTDIKRRWARSVSSLHNQMAETMKPAQRLEEQFKIIGQAIANQAVTQLAVKNFEEGYAASIAKLNAASAERKLLEDNYENFLLGTQPPAEEESD